MKTLLLSCFCLVLGFAQAQCSSDPFHGEWNSDFGPLTIWYTSGNNIVGTYTYTNSNGIEEKGTINCAQSCMYCDEDREDWCYVLKGTWKQSYYGGSSSGTIVFYLNYDQTPWKFSGEWQTDGTDQWGYWHVWR